MDGALIRREASRLEVRWIFGCAAACALLVAACGRGDSEAPRRAEATPAPASAAEARPDRPLAPGTAHLRYASGRVTLEANAAPVRPLLERLAAEARFELRLEPVDWPPLTASFADLALAEALARLIGNHDYTAQWRASASGEGPHLALLRVGAEVVADSANRKEREALPLDQDDRAKGKKSSVAGGVAGTLARAMRQRPPERETQEALLAKIHDPSAQVRMDAAAEIRPEGEGIHALSQLLVNDPDPGVRAAATAGLEVADDPAAVEALIAGLGDPEPSVVVEVLDSLEFAGDATVIPRIVPLLQHSDSAVREAAQDAIDFLGD